MFNLFNYNFKLHKAVFWHKRSLFHSTLYLFIVYYSCLPFAYVFSSLIMKPHVENLKNCVLKHTKTEYLMFENVFIPRFYCILIDFINFTVFIVFIFFIVFILIYMFLVKPRIWTVSTLVSCDDSLEVLFACFRTARWRSRGRRFPYCERRRKVLSTLLHVF